MNVLSLFDGISCGRVALERAGVPVSRYFASEVDKHAITVSVSNWPDIVQVGDVCKIHEDDFDMFFPKIDLLIGGSPCQGFSYAGKRLNFEDPRSKLFFEFVRLLDIAKRNNPRLLFLLENVVMVQAHIDVISRCLGVQPILINSKSVSAQDRKRLYWTNIPDVRPPEDRNVLFSDLVPGHWCGGMRGRRIDERGVRKDADKSIPSRQHLEARTDNKSNCLTTVDKDNVVLDRFIKREPVGDNWYRFLTLEEYESLQTLPQGYVSRYVSSGIGKPLIGNGWTADVIAHIFSYI